MKNLTLLILVFCFSTSLHGQFRSKQIIGDHAVLQRGEEIPISGWGTPGEKVKVTIDNKEYPTTADGSGWWSVKLPPMKAGGPYEININSADNGLTYRDIYFGDVWLCSGQSNMEWLLLNTDDAEKNIAEAQDGMIRHFKVDHLNADTPQFDLPSGNWEVCSPETAAGFTAVGYYFAQSIRKTNDVPIGLLNSSWGGSRIEPWMNKELLDASHPEYAYSAYTTKNEIDFLDKKEKLKKRFPDIGETDSGMKEDKPLWVNDSSSKWKSINPEELWETQGYDLIDGVAYYRTYFESKGSDISMLLGAIDDNDMTWVNGVQVGATNGYNLQREYRVPANILKDGKNELLIRVLDTGGGGGLYSTEHSTDLAGRPITEYKWEMRLGAMYINTLSNQIPNLIYNAMIHPILDFPVKGVIWYQGESNTGSIQEAYDYRKLLPSLIGQWRQEWRQEELPFYYVQLANFRQPMDEPGSDNWAVIRESMNETLSLPFTGQAVIIDIGEANDIHPRNKKDVGYRLALPARNQVYGEDVVPGSPMYASHEVVGNHVVIDFKQVGEGLEVKNRYGYVNGFSIAGEGGEYVWAKAKLEKGKVIVWNESVSQPVSVRYAWETNPFDANLFSKDGLPVTPFRCGEN